MPLQASLAEKEQILLNITSMGHKGLASQPAPAVASRGTNRKASVAAKHAGTKDEDQPRRTHRQRSAKTVQPVLEQEDEEELGAQKHEQEEYLDAAAGRDGGDQQLEDEMEDEQLQEIEQVSLAPVKHVHFKPTSSSGQRHTVAPSRTAGQHGTSAGAWAGNAASPLPAVADPDRNPHEFAFGVLEASAARPGAVRAAKVMPSNTAIK